MRANKQRRDGTMPKNDVLRTKRFEANESQSDLAQAVGVSVAAISAYENGERVPRFEVMRKLAKHYDTTIEELFSND